ncbi:MAG: hypothetical protein MI757_19715 [Pirellulales bacterium]|nr:hypothetical protein [Pirellulales bacterium]
MFRRYRAAIAVLTIVCALPLAAVALTSANSQAACACCGESCRCVACACDEAGCNCKDGTNCACTDECCATGCGHCSG